ncbi:hypothetical protein [Variovorax paradoxus]|uniref:hypothetical protein n=1 Tax=Variovorax paradoxus TaxID=34073 RepID=UPI001932A7D8|nr:hypothetical protein INQ48_18045 [Variovorax paradoxus]
MTARQPFSPAYGTGQAVAPGAASAAVPINASNNQVRIVNTGAAIAFVRTFSQAAQAGAVATAADMPIPPNMAVTITKDISHDRLAFISAAGTTLQVITGEGW